MKIGSNGIRIIRASIGLLPLAAILLLGYRISPHRFEGIEPVIAKYLSSRIIDISYAETIEREAAIFARNTPYGGRINTRQIPRQDYLNIYVLGSDPLRRFNQLRCNCAYIGHRIILCDKRFLDTFAASLRYSKIDSIPVLNRVNQGFTHVLFLWILGHEIGHAVLHDADGRFTTANNWQQHWIGNSRSDLWQTREREADEFVANRFTSSEIRMASFTLMNMVFQVYHRAYIEQHSASEKPKLNWTKPLDAIRHIFQQPASNSTSVIKIRPIDGIHDPWVFRALRMASILEKREGPEAVNSSYLSQLSANFVISAGGFDPGEFCDGLPLRRD